ncbi:MAG: ATPase [Candidatus Moranbacteria bacterium RIFCSPLOWO2_12_FULL_48_12]|nr:MAG: ATPase [Candidatus Moranbacteria bacterium RIFCSPLOWO2_12_FULL_48_12]
MKFINRATELVALNEKWKSGRSQLFIIYGKRRVGKTELMKQFGKKKPFLYFLADKRSQLEQLKELGRIAGEFFDDTILAKRGFTDWVEAFQYFKDSKKRFVFVIDEYPYLVESDKATSSLFQKGWDTYLKDTGIFLLLSGSSIAMMESETLIQKSPLFGRRTGQLLVEPLTFGQARKFYPKKPFHEFMQFYAITGGMPAYLLQMNPDLSLEENIMARIFPPTEFLFNEIEFTLKEELREPKNYLAILRAISWGKRKFGEIGNDTGLPKNVLTKYLSVLEHLHLIEKEVPITESNKGKSRKGLYRITDNFFRFWFQFVYPYKSELQIGRTEEILARYKVCASSLEAVVYERVCCELLRSFEKNIFLFDRIGRWWEGNTEIDIVGLNEKKKQIVFGECKWSAKSVGTNIYTDLKKKAATVQWERGKRKEFFILFSKSGFTEDMRRLAKKENVFLVYGDKLLRK